MSKATLRALREQCGHSQQSLADALGVNVRSVKRWEHEADASVPPKDAWVALTATLSMQRQMAAYAVEVATKQAAMLGCPNVVQLTYYRDQAMYDLYGRDEGYFGVANANSRAAAEALRSKGYEVEFSYPTDSAPSIEAARSATESE